MRELFKLLFTLKFKDLMLTPTDNGFIKFFRYCFVGGIAFVVDYLAFTLTCLALGVGDIITAIGTTVGFICGVIVNFLLSKKFVFTENATRTSLKGEFLWYFIIGAVGWGLNVLLMMIFTSWIFSINRYIAKIIVAIIVLVYNYTARKLILYSGSPKNGD